MEEDKRFLAGKVQFQGNPPPKTDERQADVAEGDLDKLPDLPLKPADKPADQPKDGK